MTGSWDNNAAASISLSSDSIAGLSVVVMRAGERFLKVLPHGHFGHPVLQEERPIILAHSDGSRRTNWFRYNWKNIAEVRIAFYFPKSFSLVLQKASPLWSGNPCELQVRGEGGCLEFEPWSMFWMQHVGVTVISFKYNIDICWPSVAIFILN